MDRDDRRQQQFNEFIARKAGTRSWFIREPGGRQTGQPWEKPITRKEFERWRAEFEALTNA